MSLRAFRGQRNIRKDLLTLYAHRIGRNTTTDETHRGSPSREEVNRRKTLFQLSVSEQCELVFGSFDYQESLLRSVVCLPGNRNCTEKLNTKNKASEAQIPKQAHTCYPGQVRM